MSTDYIFRIEELGQEFNSLVGKKCANLGEMAKIGLRVPPGLPSCEKSSSPRKCPGK
ncbi:MAG: hypothetical protein H6Q48_891 [Deltaproteobacteria bacterium]|nr:hypothetical protein [Deltaproteobacteria bacterium]